MLVSVTRGFESSIFEASRCVGKCEFVWSGCLLDVKAEILRYVDVRVSLVGDGKMKRYGRKGGRL